ncbi:MAG: hypothetical protein ING60_03995 [Rhodocyclaceae bacterium]|nr:hypothetical protein [Rhodocyclaceae bacterium]
MDAFFGHLIDAVVAGHLSKDSAVSKLSLIVTAVDIGDYGEAIKWFEEGRKRLVDD